MLATAENLADPKSAAPRVRPDDDTARSILYLRSALPLAKVLREEHKAKYDKLLRGFNAIVQFEVKNEDALATHLVFVNGEIEAKLGRYEKPTVRFVFPTKTALNGFFGGKVGLAYMPRITPLWRLDVILRVLPLLLGLKILDPKNLPKDPAGRALKVKMVLYMITNALSRLNRMGDPSMVDWTKNQPDRIFQWSVDGGPAAYLRVKGGRSKSGRGEYTRKRPFIHMRFTTMDGAFLVLTSQALLVEAVAKGYLVTEGSPEYAKDIGTFMQKIEVLLK
ncbi:hypothetical protein K8I61_01500 [bacterium]|nr:hypothetical protein [bacterium]